MSAPMDPARPEPGLAPSGAPAQPGRGRLLVLAAAAGLVAGLVAWLVGELTLGLFVPSTTQLPMGGVIVSRVGYYENAESDYKNATFAYSILGASLGLTLGLTAGWARRDLANPIRAAASGIVLGAVLAAGAAAVILPVYYHEADRNPVQLTQDLMLPLLVHAGCWAASGLAGGLAWGLGLGAGGRDGGARMLRAGLGGAVGAGLGAIVYEVTAGLAFPAARSSEPLSNSATTRCLARVAVAVLAALMTALVTESRPSPVVAADDPAPPPPATPDPA